MAACVATGHLVAASGGVMAAALFGLRYRAIVNFLVGIFLEFRTLAALGGELSATGWWGGGMVDLLGRWDLSTYMPLVLCQFIPSTALWGRSCVPHCSCLW